MAALQGVREMERWEYTQALDTAAGTALGAAPRRGARSRNLPEDSCR